MLFIDRQEKVSALIVISLGAKSFTPFDWNLKSLSKESWRSSFLSLKEEVKASLLSAESVPVGDEFEMKWSRDKRVKHAKAVNSVSGCQKSLTEKIFISSFSLLLLVYFCVCLTDPLTWRWSYKSISPSFSLSLFQHLHPISLDL